jgi:hypothetical protein
MTHQIMTMDQSAIADRSNKSREHLGALSGYRFTNNRRLQSRMLLGAFTVV